ncbi:ATP-binding cassette domain-containing protein [Alloprevotella rava]|uniref:ABC transporter domain-containing protein n=2 Tax=Alloprevotella rava TaxID=671218 RepID=G5GDU1_9BACT|nr:ATP-binding cassette domain-containing protein [Alloprevotella rava]EHG21224.1 hypothetical protein HMPREF9332_01743 [Alloprevotella rava F0323]MBB3703162.1 ABC-type lipoprotein export system ATPase subunit [Alloprevotella rava]
MNTIKLNNVLPHVFSQRTDLKSEVWKHELSFEKGQLYLVEAMSGTGKSTLCSYILGYRQDFSGQLTFDDKDTQQFSVSNWVDIRKKHISHLFQELRLFSELTAMENVQIKNRLTDFKTEKQINEWFEMLDIADKTNTKIGRMSFGQQQRVALIRALVQPFDFLFADEPISHLDDHNSSIMGEIMMKEAHKQGAGVIITSIGKHMQLNYDKTFRL